MIKKRKIERTKNKRKREIARNIKLKIKDKRTPSKIIN